MYEEQDRGSQDAYEAYYAGMDKSMRQKIALISSYFPVQGRVADMGSGSGSGSHDLAGLYPGLQVIGVDVNPRSVEYSNERYRRDNLEYVVGDIAEPVFPDEHLDGILNSSVLHHVTSFNDFSLERVRQLFDHQVAELRDEGILAVRDFVVPSGPEIVELELPDDDGLSAAEARERKEATAESLSTAALFEKFAREFRNSRHPNGGFHWERVSNDEPNDASKGAKGGANNGKTAGRSRFRLGFREAVEFVLRKDYRRDWDVEILEEYTYLPRAEFEAEYRRRGLRVILSREIFNPWIVRNRFEGRFRMLDGSRELDPPPTNYIIIGQKAPAGGGVYLREANVLAENHPTYLRLEHYRESESGRIWDLAGRPEAVIDIIPYDDSSGELTVFARQGYPRPILQTDVPLDEAASSGYINEPISAVRPHHDPDEADRIVAELLEARTGILARALGPGTDGLSYYPSPGGTGERVQARLIPLRDAGAWRAARSEGSGFSTSGQVRPFQATQTLRAAQVGGMFDARLELNIYDLLLRLGRSPGPYIGAELETEERAAPTENVYTDFEELYLDRFGAERILFTPTPRSGDFIQVRRSLFIEENAFGETIAERELEYVLPRDWSARTISFLPYTRDEAGACWIGIEERHLPAPFVHTGRARLFACPAWRLPREIAGQRAALEFARTKLRAEFDCDSHRPTPLGGSYLPSPGLSPESVTPFAAPISKESLAASRLTWLPLEQLIRNRDRLDDGHFMIALLRFWHATRNGATGTGAS